MRLPADDSEGWLLGARTANDRLKAGHPARMHRSIVASVLFHVAIILAWPELDTPSIAAGGLPGSGALQLESIGAPSGAGVGHGISFTIGVEDEGLDTLADTTEPDGDDDAPEGWEGRSAEFWRLAALRPRFADPVRADADGGTEFLDSTEPGSGGTDDEGLRIRSRTADLGYERLSEEEMLSLQRLSALRPEIVLGTPSNWLLIRNPKEVGAFMRTRFDDHGVAADLRGYLSVSIWVDERGSVEWAEINQSSGDPRLDASALEMFRTVVAFQPAREEGMRVPMAAIFWLSW